MLKNARRMGMDQKIFEIPPQAKRLANERDLKLRRWELSSLLESLGLEIENILGTGYPAKRDEKYYTSLY